MSTRSAQARKLWVMNARERPQTAGRTPRRDQSRIPRWRTHPRLAGQPADRFRRPGRRWLRRTRIHPLPRRSKPAWRPRETPAEAAGQRLRVGNPWLDNRLRQVPRRALCRERQGERPEARDRRPTPERAFCFRSRRGRASTGLRTAGKSCLATNQFIDDSGTADLYTVDAQTGALQLIPGKPWLPPSGSTMPSGVITAPSWSPDGTKIIFNIDYSGHSGFMIIPAAGA